MNPAPPDSTSDQAGDPEAGLARLRSSAPLALEQALAGAGDCPSPNEVAALGSGRIADARVRAALGRHLAFCPNCLERNLRVLAPRREGVLLSLRAVAAAAALLVVSLIFSSGAPAPRGLDLLAVAATDRYGFENRSPLPPPAHDLELPRRVAATAAREGHVALARVVGGKVVLEPVAGASLLLPVAAGEEVLLPVDRAVGAREGEQWLVLFAPHPVDEAVLAKAAADLLRGYDGGAIGARRLTVR